MKDDKIPLLQFKNYEKMLKVPIVYYADFECVLKKINDETIPEDKNMIKFNQHEPCAYAIKSVSIDSFHDKFIMYTGNNAKDTIKNFIECIISEGKHVDELLNKRYKDFQRARLSETEQQQYQNSDVCIYCDEEFSDLRYKVRDLNKSDAKSIIYTHFRDI